MAKKLTRQLIQMQCQREGTLFYYQTVLRTSTLPERCPMCGSKRVMPTGRVYPPVAEDTPSVI